MEELPPIKPYIVLEMDTEHQRFFIFALCLFTYFPLSHVFLSFSLSLLYLLPNQVKRGVPVAPTL